MRHWALFFLVASYWHPLLAQERIALVIGNSEYASIPELENPVNDAQDIASLLRSIGFQVVLGVDLTESQFEAALEKFGEQARKSDIALVFYAGHGIQVDGENYLMPINARLRSRRDLGDLIDLGFVLEQASRASGLGVVILDACRENPLANLLAFKSGKRTVKAGRGLGRIGRAPTDVLVAFATEADDVAADGTGERNSPFSKALKEHIATPGLELRLMFGKVRDSVLRATEERQRPFFEGSLGGRPYYLVPKQKVEPSKALLAVKPSPHDALVRIMNIVPTYTGPMELLPGQYDIEVSKSGYITYREWIELEIGERVLNVTLEQQPSGEPPRDLHVAALLIQAEQDRAARRLVRPTGNNALSRYEEVLRLIPDNSAALEGKKRLAEHFLGIARRQLQTEAFTDGIASASDGLLVLPDYPDLIELKELLQAKLDQVKREKQAIARKEQEVNALLSEAQKLWQAPPSSQEELSLIYEAYLAVQQLQPDHPAAIDGIRSLTQKVIELAQQQYQAGVLAESEALWELGHKLSPGNSSLQSLRRALDNPPPPEEPASDTHIDHIEKMLVQVDRLISENKLTLPRGDNAFELLLAVEIQSGENRAISRRVESSFRRIADRYLSLADGARRNGKYRAALELINKGLRVVSGHKDLIALKEVTQQDLRRRITAQPRRKSPQTTADTSSDGVAPATAAENSSTAPAPKSSSTDTPVEAPRRAFGTF